MTNGVGAKTGPGRVVVLGGGAVGRLMATTFADSHAKVVLVDKASSGTEALSDVTCVAGDVLAVDSTLAAYIAEADVVVAALHTDVLLLALSSIVSMMKPHALLVDTLSAKGEFAHRVEDIAADITVLGLNPMFAPELAARFEGRAVITVDYGTNGNIHDAPVHESLIAAGARLMGPYKPAAHDGLMQALQVIPHATVLAAGSVVASRPPSLSGVGIGQVVPLIVGRIVNKIPKTYWEIQASGPMATDARKATIDALQRLHSDRRVYDELVELLGDELIASARVALSSAFNRSDDHEATTPSPSTPDPASVAVLTLFGLAVSQTAGNSTHALLPISSPPFRLLITALADLLYGGRQQFEERMSEIDDDVLARIGQGVAAIEEMTADPDVGSIEFEQMIRKIRTCLGDANPLLIDRSEQVFRHVASKSFIDTLTSRAFHPYFPAEK